MNTREIPYLYLKKLGIDPEGIAIPNRRGAHLKRKFNTNIEVVLALYKGKDREEAAKILGYAQTRGKTQKGLEKALREKCSYLFENKPGTNLYFNFMNNFCGYHWCKECKKLEKLERFDTVKRGEKSVRVTEYHSRCREEHAKNMREALKIYRNTPNGRAVKNYHSAKRRAMLRNQQPPWADEKEMKEFFKSSSREYHVDHIIPLNHPLVSGLNCEFNLRVIPAKENLQKSNKFDLVAYNEEAGIPDKTTIKK